MRSEGQGDPAPSAAVTALSEPVSSSVKWAPTEGVGVLGTFRTSQVPK